MSLSFPTGPSSSISQSLSDDRPTRFFGALSSNLNSFYLEKEERTRKSVSDQFSEEKNSLVIPSQLLDSTSCKNGRPSIEPIWACKAVTCSIIYRNKNRLHRSPFLSRNWPQNSCRSHLDPRHQFSSPDGFSLCPCCYVAIKNRWEPQSTLPKPPNLRLLVIFSDIGTQSHTEARDSINDRNFAVRLVSIL